MGKSGTRLVKLLGQLGPPPPSVDEEFAADEESAATSAPHGAELRFFFLAFSLAWFFDSMGFDLFLFLIFDFDFY
jgi:hypothetical protein